MDSNAMGKANEYFKDEVKNLLSGYIPSEDTRNYLALKISRLHELYLNEVNANE